MRLLLAMLLVLAASVPTVLATGAMRSWAQESRAEETVEPTRAAEPETGSTSGGTSGGMPARPSVRGQTCLSGADMREVVAERKVLEPLAAIRAAREALPRAEIVRVNLCHREGEPLFYLVTALRRDGQFVHLTVDSKSGAVAALQ